MNKIKRFLKQLITNPNSPEGLRMRADMLIEKGYSDQNPYVLTLLKQANLKEGQEND